MDFTRAKKSFTAYSEAVESAELAAIGTRKIYRSGLISAIDSIDTEQVLLNSKVDLENAKHELILSAYTVLSIVGEITPS